MTIWRRHALLGLLLLGVAGPVRAGVYNFAEPDEGKLNPHYLLWDRQKTPPLPPFHNTLFDLKLIGYDKLPEDRADYPLRMRYRLAAELAGKASTAKLTLAQKINLSAALIRCRRYDEAVNLLAPLASQYRDNFFVHANLATAYWHVPQQQERALSSLEQALSVWPKDFEKLSNAKQEELAKVGFVPPVYDFYRTMEGYHLKLLRLRAREGNREVQNVDALFDDGQKPANPVKFVGESGAFEPGAIARSEKAKLDALKPNKAIDIVQQLLIWMPDDLRLYWLLGELYNAQGDIEAAQTIFRVVGDLQTGLRVPEFRSRMQVLLNTPTPEGDLPPPQELDDKLKQVEGQKGTANAIDLRSLGVGGLIGAAVALFTLWQVREWRRRKQRDVSTQHRV